MSQRSFYQTYSSDAKVCPGGRVRVRIDIISEISKDYKMRFKKRKKQ